MICIKRVFETAEQAAKVKEQFHHALVGSPAYINSEIAITDGDAPNEFFLVVGNSNANNLETTLVEADSNAVKPGNEPTTRCFG